MSEALGPVTLAPRDNQFLPGQGGFGVQGEPGLRAYLKSPLCVS
jgi:hypothetical protein